MKFVLVFFFVILNSVAKLKIIFILFFLKYYSYCNLINLTSYSFILFIQNINSYVTHHLECFHVYFIYLIPNAFNFWYFIFVSQSCNFLTFHIAICNVSRYLGWISYSTLIFPDIFSLIVR